MRHDLPVVSRQRVAGLVDKAADLRARFERSRQVMAEQGGIQALLDRLLHGGADVSREEFAAVAIWVPAISRHLYQACSDLVSFLASTQRTLERRTRRGALPSDQQLLRVYWQAIWALGHLTLLISCDDREALERAAREAPDAHAGLTYAAFSQGISGVALRAVWATAKSGKLALPFHERQFAAAATPVQLFYGMLCLLAIGLRHRPLRGRVKRALARPPAPADLPRAADLDALIEAGAATVEQVLQHGEQQVLVAQRAGAIRWCKMSAHLAPGSPHRYQQPDDVPPEIALASYCRHQSLFLARFDEVPYLAACLPWLARARAEDLYLPAEQIRAAPAAWTPEISVRILAASRGYFGTPMPAQAAARPGRNQPCPCGSGKKYKHCCGADPGHQGSA
ncbi:MAG: SEC-C domain-containing protein [Deltaproteobacteria bacterium]|nr:SEC-C domain-containing protein [Deltaproteobacteria bacterium]